MHRGQRPERQGNETSARMTSGRAQRGRNEPCPCGSGRKYKQCCGAGAASGVPQPAPEALMRQAMEAVRAGRAEVAGALFAQVLRQQPDHADALMMLGMLAGRSGRVPEAIQLLQRAIALRPGFAGARLLLANVHREAGQIDQAIAVLQDALRRHPDDATLHSDLGLAYLCGHRPAEAVASSQRAVALDPKLAAAFYNLACALDQQRRFADALAAYARAVALAPGLAEAHSRMGNLLHAQGHREQALACFRRATAAAPGTAVGRLNQVKVLMEEEKSGEAEQLLRTITTTDPGNAEACRLLGNILRETGRFEEAVTWLERAIVTDRTHIAAYHDLVYAKKLTPADRDLIGHMRERLQGADLTAQQRTLLHFAIGKGFDDLGEYAAAIDHFDAGNQLERQGLSFDPARFAAQIDQLIERFTPEFLAAHAGLGDPDDAPVLVLGMPRSGTTLVEQILSSHPRVAGGGELRFWNEHAAGVLNTGTGPLAAATVQTLARDYLAVLRGVSPQAARIVDKMPFNFLWAGLIRLAFPNASIIHCRRHPIDTCLSIYFTRFATRQDFAYDRDDLAFYYRQYRRLMDHWRRVLEPGCFLEIDYETLVDDRTTATRRLIAFLRLDWDDACLQPERNARVVKTVSMWQARQPVYRTSVARWRGYEPWLGALRDL
jgi:tetratricopeptide (TPR) repeat protein